MIPPETCDDGYFDAVGCNQTCNGTFPGYTCSGGNLNNPSSCVAGCGDGILTPT